MAKEISTDTTARSGLSSGYSCVAGQEPGEKIKNKSSKMRVDHNN